jgi:hypothetical protein
MSHFLVKLLAIFLLLAGLVLSSCHTGTGNYVFMDELSRAVQQFYPGSGSGVFSNPTPPPGNSGVELVPITQQEGERPEMTPKRKLFAVVDRQLREYRKNPVVVQEFPWLIYKDHKSMVQHFISNNLEIEMLPDAEVVKLADHFDRKDRSGPAFKAYLDDLFFYEKNHIEDAPNPSPSFVEPCIVPCDRDER